MALDGYKGLDVIQGAHFTPAASVTRWPTVTRMKSAKGDVIITGILWVTLAMVLFSGLAAFARVVINYGLPAAEVAFMRNVIAVTALLPLMLMRGRELFATENLPLYGLRCVFSTVSMTSWFCALALIPLGQLTAIGFLAPLFGTLAAIVILGEVVRARRWTALCVGFAGAMIILRPTTSGFNVGQLFAIVSAMLGGCLAIMVKQLTIKDDPNRIVCLTSLFMTPMSLIPALFDWRWPTLDMFPALLAMGICGVLGHLALTRAFAAIDASLVLTFEFIRLPFVVVVAYLAFGETIDSWTWLGATIIFGSAFYITRREAQLRKSRATVATPG